MNHSHVIRMIVIVTLLMSIGALPVRSGVPHLGYGFNVAAIDTARLQAMNFNWIKVFDVPAQQLPQYTLIRVDVTTTTSVSNLQADLDAKLAFLSANSISVEAWEIGNEVNIDASYGWGGTPDVAAYKNLLCAAYNKIKSQRPNAIVVSAGLAPVGRSSDMHQIDERVYLQQLLDTGGACLDVVGFHPYGYSADFNAVPDVVSADPTQNCDQGFCFRGAEKMYEVMQTHGAGDKKMWATEFGWITQPPQSCFDDPTYGPDWATRRWQIVSDARQASNLVGAFQYADAHWSWMGAMFVFNLNFNLNPDLFECNQMRYYSVQSRPAEAALTTMPKNSAFIPGNLKIDPKSLSVMIDVDWQPITSTYPIYLMNYGWQAFNYTATVKASAPVVPHLLNPIGILSPTAQLPLQIQIGSSGRVTGTYAGTVTIVASPGALGSPRTVPIELRVVQEVHSIYLPLTVLDTP
jgi:hypothetical protein